MEPTTKLQLAALTTLVNKSRLSLEQLLNAYLYTYNAEDGTFVFGSYTFQWSPLNIGGDWHMYIKP